MRKKNCSSYSDSSLLGKLKTKQKKLYFVLFLFFFCMSMMFFFHLSIRMFTDHHHHDHQHLRCYCFGYTFIIYILIVDVVVDDGIVYKDGPDWFFFVHKCCIFNLVISIELFPKSEYISVCGLSTDSIIP